VSLKKVFKILLNFFLKLKILFKFFLKNLLFIVIFGTYDRSAHDHGFNFFFPSLLQMFISIIIEYLQNFEYFMWCSNSL